MSITDSVAPALSEDVPARVETGTVALATRRKPPRTKTTKIKEPIAGKVLKWLILALVALVMLVPLYIMVISAFKPAHALGHVDVDDDVDHRCRGEGLEDLEGEFLHLARPGG